MDNKSKNGVIYAVAAYMLWGVLPIYWKLFKGVSPMHVLANRILWAFVFMAIWLAVTGKFGDFLSAFKVRHNITLIFAASVLIAVNWGVFIWAVGDGRILETSLGYYINPLIAVALGIIIFKEKLNKFQVVSIVLAFIGIMVRSLGLGAFPWVSLTLAFSFGIYSAIKKYVPVSSAIGLAVETAMLFPLALGFIIYEEITGKGTFFNPTVSASNIILLILSGAITAIPLLLFAKGAKRLKLSTVGFIQYIGPSLMLMTGVFIYGEKFNTSVAVSFVFIWAACLVYLLGSRNKNGKVS